VIDVSVLVGCQVRDLGGRTGRVTSVSLPFVKVAWNQDHLFRAVEETYARSAPTIWTDFEIFTLNGGWVSMGSILGSRPRGRVAQFTEDLENLLSGSEKSVEERQEIPEAPTEVSWRETRKLPFRRRGFESQREASEFVAELLIAEQEEIRWRTDDMEEDWEVELTGLFQALAEGCRSCEGNKLESFTGTNLFERKRGEQESKPEDWDCDDEGECVYVPTGFKLQIDVGE